MCAGARLLALLIVATPSLVGAKPTSALWVEHVGAQAKPTAAKPSANRQKTRFASPKAETRDEPADRPTGGPAAREESVKLLGFSRNEAIAAVQVTVRETRAGRT